MIIPPWLNFDPNAAAQLRLQASGQRNQLALAGLQAELARERQDQEAAQQNAALQFKYQELADMGDYRREESERRKSEGAALERLRQQKYEQDALEASIRNEGMRDYEASVARGEDRASAFARNAHKLLYKNEGALERYVQNMGEQGGGLEEATTSEGAHYLSRRGGTPHFIPQSSLPETEGPPGLIEVAPGVTVLKTSRRGYQVIDKPTPAGGLTGLEQSKLTDLGRQKTYYQSVLKGGVSEADLKEYLEKRAAHDALEDVKAAQQEIWDTIAKRGQKLPIVTTKEEYDALPHKSYYKNKAGAVGYKE